MNKTEQAIMASDLEYQKRLANNNARLLILADNAVARVRELHQQDGDYCAVCARVGGGYSGGYRTVWPCDTIVALDGEQE